MSAGIGATANATEASQQAKERWSPSVARARTTPSIAPASGWRSSTRLPISGRALVSTKAPRADTSRRAAGEGLAADGTPPQGGGRGAAGDEAAHPASPPARRHRRVAPEPARSRHEAPPVRQGASYDR